MHDFRYHLISIVAVFLALGIGVLLGVTIADSGVVSGARDDLQRSLRKDLRQARAAESESAAGLADRDEFEEEVYPILVGGLLPRMQVGLVVSGGRPSGVATDVRQALLPTGAALASIAVVRVPPDREALSRALARTRYADVDVNLGSLGELGRRVGRQLVTGGPLRNRVRDALMASLSGSGRRLDGVVFVRQPREVADDTERAAAARLEAALVDGMARTDVPVVGVEQTSSDSSQVGFYRDHDLTSIDSVDLVSGRVALTYALLGARGSYGVKHTADQLLPQPPGLRARS